MCLNYKEYTRYMTVLKKGYQINTTLPGLIDNTD